MTCGRIASSRWPWHNNRSAEILAVVRRGPFAKPTETEQLEYLFTRVSRTDSRKDFEKHSLEHVLSFQKRVLKTKQAFLHRGHRTPLGIVEDYWDRTEVGCDIRLSHWYLKCSGTFRCSERKARLHEGIWFGKLLANKYRQAQQRGSLHAHILVWFKHRRRPKGWTALPPIEAKKKGAEPKQRSLTDKIIDRLDDDEFQEDSIYQLAEIGRISGEMPRPNVANADGLRWGGFDCGTLRIAGLCRSVLIKLNYHHVCTPAYCLKNRTSCRFFFPWPQQKYQVYDENTQRIALRRALCDDDQWVVPHNLSAAPQDCQCRHPRLRSLVSAHIVGTGGLVLDNVFHEQRERHWLRPEPSTMAVVRERCYRCLALTYICW